MKTSVKVQEAINRLSPNPRRTQSTIALAPREAEREKPNFQNVTETENETDTICGIGSFQPKFFQKLATPKVFLLFFSIAGLLQGAQFTYLVGCMTTLEKRFSYDTRVSGLINIADEVGPILLGVLIGYFCGEVHRPRIMAIGILLSSASCFIMAAPYFVYGSAYEQQTSIFPINTTNRLGVKAQFCEVGTNRTEICKSSPTVAAVSMLLLGNFVKGTSTVIYYTVGTTYMDDSVKKKNSPFYLGVTYALRMLGPTLGFLLSSVCLQYFEDPFYDPGFSPKDPRWIGAWWLGFIILGLSIFIFAIPLTLFPRRLPGKKTSLSPKKKGAEEPENLRQQLKGMLKATLRLAKNPILMCYYLGGVFRLNGLIGYYVLLPKYMEMQFKQSASKANLYSGPASIISMQVGILLGGIAISKIKPRPRVLVGSMIFAESFSFVGLLCCMLITCPTLQMTGTSYLQDQQTINLQNECNADCKCTTQVFTPVCGPDGKSTYFSPCYAGCTEYNKTDSKEVFKGCKCVHDINGELTVGNAEKSYCDSECQWLILFVVALSIGKLIASTSRVSGTIITLRCVAPEDKSIALGTSTGIFSLLAFIPYPLIYGALADASCLVWEQSCGRRGNCWIYDPDKFRFLLHGVSAMFVLLGVFSDIFVCILSPRLRDLYDDEVNEDSQEVGKCTKDTKECTNFEASKTGYSNSSFEKTNAQDDTNLSSPM